METDVTLDFDAVMALARGHRLSYYDAVFVELAIRLDAELATLDMDMARAAEAECVLIA